MSATDAFDPVKRSIERQHKVAVTAKIAREQAAKAAKKSDGVWGYSGPNSEHVIFTPDDGMHEFVRRVLQNNDMWWLECTGCWKGEREASIIVTYDDWLQLRPAIEAIALRDQECVMRLGHLQSRNWRDAYLMYLQEPRDNEELGTWMSATEDEALKQDYTWVPDIGYFIVVNNPPIDEEDRKERELVQLVFDLRTQLWAAAEICPQEKCPAFGFIPGCTVFGAYKWLIGKTLPNGQVITHDMMVNAGKGARAQWWTQ